MIDFSEHLLPAARDTIVAFAGGNQNKYQWANVLARLNKSHALFRCTPQNHYQQGVAGIGGPLHVLAYLKRLAPVTCVGVSIGAYGALLYGQLAQVARVVVFSPLTGRETDDFPPAYHEQIRAAQEDPIIDLRQFFPTGPTPRTSAYISDGPATEVDRRMCERLYISDITLVPGYAHGDLARGMRDTGMLERILRGGVN